MTAKQWAKALKKVCQAVPFPQTEDTGTAWDQGGCHLFAKALQRVLGGKLQAICRYEDGDARDYPVQHFVLELDGYLIDSTGIYPKEQGVELITKQWPKTIRDGNVLKRPTDPDVWCGDHFYDLGIYRKLCKAIRHHWGLQSTHLVPIERKRVAT